MAKDPAFLFYPGDYLRDTQCLSESVQVAYDRIMCEHMRNICISQAQHDFFTKRLNDDQKKELSMVLQQVAGGYQIGWVAESIEKRRSYSKSRSNNRKGIKKTHDNHMKTYDEHMENEIENENKDDNKVFINEVFQYFCLKLHKKIQLSKERASIIAKRLEEGRTVQEMKRAIDNFAKDDWADRHKFCDIVYVLGVRNKVDNLDKWLVGKPDGKPVPANHPKDCPECWGTGLIYPPGGKPVTCFKVFNQITKEL